MKYLFTLLYLLSVFTLAAQEKAGEQAVFTECTNSDTPYTCTLEKFKNDIGQLLTPEFQKELRYAKAEYFPVSIILLTDENGKIVPEETDILCPYEPLKKAIKNYLLSLPVFHPKDVKQKDRRSVFILNYTFVYSTIKKYYYIASKKLLNAAHIKQESLPFDSQPTYAECQSETDTESKCFRDVFNRIFNRKMRFPKYDSDTVIKLHLLLRIANTGDISLVAVDTDDVDLINEINRVVTKLPKAEPSKVRGLAITSFLNLPITINIKY